MSNDLTIEESLALEISERKMYEALHFEALQREAKLKQALSRIGNICPVSNFQECRESILEICKEALSSEYPSPLDESKS